jgi:hypothetical protein
MLETLLTTVIAPIFVGIAIKFISLWLFEKDDDE